MATELSVSLVTMCLLSLSTAKCRMEAPPAIVASGSAAVGATFSLTSGVVAAAGAASAAEATPAVDDAA